MNLPSIVGTPEELHQVILNLCRNAIHAMPNGGELTIRLRKSDFRDASRLKEIKEDTNFLVLGIHDTGTGIEPAIIERIFDPFFTTREVGDGTGLGLSAVQGIVEQHNGKIVVESEPGRGANFYLYFPTIQESTKPHITYPKPVSHGREKILVVDDESLNALLVKTVLEDLGYQVKDFLDSMEALEVFKQQSQMFDLVITDYKMPYMNGKQLAEQLKQIYTQVPIIMLTGYHDQIVENNIASWKVDKLLAKPFDIKEFGKIVRSVLDESTTLT
ncbi:MAG: ATP-binding protein [Spirochaetota bacterium]